MVWGDGPDPGGLAKVISQMTFSFLKNDFNRFVTVPAFDHFSSVSPEIGWPVCFTSSNSISVMRLSSIYNFFELTVALTPPMGCNR